MPDPKVAIAILNWKGLAHTIECLESLETGTFRDFRIFVADNASGDGSAEKIAEWLSSRRPSVNGGRSSEELLQDQECPEASFPDGDLVLRSSRNKGFAGGYNPLLRRILQSGRFAWIFVLNNDTVLMPDALEKLVLRARSLSGLWLMGPAIQGPYEKRAMEYGGRIDPWLCTTRIFSRLEQWNASPALRYLPGTALFMPSALPERIGLFSEDFFLYYEDADFSRRAAEAGADLLLCAEAVIRHKEGRSIGSSSRPRLKAKSLTAEYHGQLSRLIYARRRHPGRLALVRLSFAAVLALRLWRLQPRSAAMVLRALMDDWLGRPPLLPKD